MGRKAEAGQLGVSSRMAGTVMVVDLAGSIRLGDEVSCLRRFLRDCMEERPPCLLLNFQGVQYVDSAGLGAVVEARAHALAMGAELRCCELPSLILKLFYQIRLGTVIEIYKTEHDALSNWG